MSLIPEARVANEILLNALRTLKFSDFDADTQKVIMRCVGETLIRRSTVDDQTIDETIQNIEYHLYRSDFPGFYEYFQL